MTTNQALVKRIDKRAEPNANGLKLLEPPPQRHTREVRPLTEELVNELLGGRGFRGWLRAAQVARVLGLFSLYLFLDTYDVRADFNRRAVARMKDLARERGRVAQFKAWRWAQLYAAFDLFIRGLRFVIFSGAESSTRKTARLRSGENTQV